MIIDGLQLLIGYDMIWLNTVLLFSSGFYATLLHLWSSQFHGSTVYVLYLMVLICASTFFCVQLLEYSANIFVMNLTITLSSFFALTGLHGFHVIVGAILIYCTHESTSTVYGNVSLEGALLYWHFVDAVWVFLLLILYELEWSEML